jgi:hypothetical protein
MLFKCFISSRVWSDYRQEFDWKSDLLGSLIHTTRDYTSQAIIKHKLVFADPMADYQLRLVCRLKTLE